MKSRHRATRLRDLSVLSRQNLQPGVTTSRSPIMARGIEGNEISTPRPPPTLKSTTSSQSDKGKGQKSILGFFGKKPDADRIPTATTNGSVKPTLAKSSQSLRPSNSNPTPAPSSDAPEPPSSVPGSSWEASGKNKENGLPSPITPVSVSADGVRKEAPGKSSPSRKVSSLPKTGRLPDTDELLGKEACELCRVGV